jgi:DNA gyrase subunit A
MGQLYWLKVYKIPEGTRTAKGKAVVNLINLRENEKIKAIIPTSDFDENKSLAFFTKNGIVKRTALNEFSNIRSNGVRAIVLDEADELVTAGITMPQDKYFMIFTAFGQVIRFEIDKTRNQGRSTRGVTGIKFKTTQDYVVDAIVIQNQEQEVLTVSEKGIGKRTNVSEYRLTNRAGSGVISMKLTNKTGKKVVGSVIVDENKDLMVLTSIGKMIRVDMGQIRTAGRNTSGVYIVKVDEGDFVVSIAVCPKEDEELNLDDNDTTESILPLGEE